MGTTSSHLRTPPTQVALTRFLEERRGRSVEDVARLLGWTRTQVQRRVVEDEVPVNGGRIPWRHSAAWLIEAWPLQALLEILDERAGLLPSGLHLTDVQWKLPFYLTYAMTVQAQVEDLPHRTIRPATLSDYMADLLHRSIDLRTLAVLRRDPEFMAAFHFPEGAR